MINLRSNLAAVVVSFAVSSTVSASDLSYTFIDFQYLGSEVEALGSQSPVPGQIVDVRADKGDGISIAGTIDFAERFYIGGSYQTSIVDVFGEIENPLIGTESVADEFDLIRTRVSFGYFRELTPTLDFVAELSYDTTDYDYGSFAGENFDVEDSGAGAMLGLRWNPTQRVELYLYGRHSAVGAVNLDQLVHEEDTLLRTGFLWYAFGDLGLGLDFESGAVDTVTVSMRFSFGDLPW